MASPFQRWLLAGRGYALPQCNSRLTSRWPWAASYILQKFNGIPAQWEHRIHDLVALLMVANRTTHSAWDFMQSLLLCFSCSQGWSSLLFLVFHCLWAWSHHAPKIPGEWIPQLICVCFSSSIDSHCQWRSQRNSSFASWPSSPRLKQPVAKSGKTSLRLGGKPWKFFSDYWVSLLVFSVF